MKHRVDDNQKEIVDCMRNLGALVAVTSKLGDGFPDLVVKYRHQLFLVEVKDGSKPPSKTKLTKKEQIFYDEWKEVVHIVYSLDDVLRLFNINYSNEPHFCHE